MGKVITQKLNLATTRTRGRRINFSADIYNQYAIEGKWLKGNCHCHLKNWTDQAEDLYHSLGYDFIAGMDHDLIVELPNRHTNLTIIPGAEISPGHIVALGITVSPPKTNSFEEQLKSIKQQNGISFVAHPANGKWTYQELQQIVAFGLNGMELINSSYWKRGDKGYADQIYQFLLAEGADLFAVGNDDAHGSDRYEKDALGRDRMGCTYVLAETASAEDILASIRAGRTFATEGPIIKNIEFTDYAKLIVESSPCKYCFFSSVGGGAITEQAKDSSLEETFIFDFNKYSFRVHEFMRIILEDDQGRRAWSSPIKIDSTIEYID